MLLDLLLLYFVFVWLLFYTNVYGVLKVGYCTLGQLQAQIRACDQYASRLPTVTLFRFRYSIIWFLIDLTRVNLKITVQIPSNLDSSNSKKMSKSSHSQSVLTDPFTYEYSSTGTGLLATRFSVTRLLATRFFATRFFRNPVFGSAFFHNFRPFFRVKSVENLC